MPVALVPASPSPTPKEYSVLPTLSTVVLLVEKAWEMGQGRKGKARGQAPSRNHTNNQHNWLLQSQDSQLFMKDGSGGGQEGVVSGVNF